MNDILLSILIPTTIDRSEITLNLVRSITDQCQKLEGYDESKSYGWLPVDFDKYTVASIVLGGTVEIIEEVDNKEMTIGEKREKLYKRASGKFSWQIDSDDNIADDAIELILNAIKSNPEIPCITFREKCLMNGVYKSSNHSIKYAQWMDNSDGYDYVRSPFYKDVIRTNIAKLVPFPKIRYNEDEQWSYAIKPLLTDEIHIDEELYIYIYQPKESHEERYGLNRN